jgi:hypothetical protein
LLNPGGVLVGGSIATGGLNVAAGGAFISAVGAGLHALGGSGKAAIAALVSHLWRKPPSFSWERASADF